MIKYKAYDAFISAWSTTIELTDADVKKLLIGNPVTIGDVILVIAKL